MDKSTYSKTPKEAGKFHAYVTSAKTTLTVQGRNVTQNVMTFAKTTSIKGLPRIINSDLKLMRVVWLTATVGFLILAALQAMILWQQFATGQTVIITEVRALLQYVNCSIIIIVLEICNFRTTLLSP